LGWIFGGYAFFDNRLTEYHNMFQQATLGLEALSELWDVRFNTYVPFSTSKKIPHTSANPKRVIFRGNEEYITARKEIALKGFDGEVGRLIPGTTSVRFYVGGYHFQNKGARKINGVRTRLTWAITDHIDVEADYQYDNVRHSAPFLWVTLRIPFGEETLKNLTPLERRMQEVIIRDIDIVTQKQDLLVPTGHKVIFGRQGGQGGGAFESPADSTNEEVILALLKSNPGCSYYDFSSNKMFTAEEKIKQIQASQKVSLCPLHLPAKEKRVKQDSIVNASIVKEPIREFLSGPIMEETSRRVSEGVAEPVIMAIPHPVIEREPEIVAAPFSQVEHEVITEPILAVSPNLEIKAESMLTPELQTAVEIRSEERDQQQTGKRARQESEERERQEAAERQERALRLAERQRHKQEARGQAVRLQKKLISIGQETDSNRAALETQKNLITEITSRHEQEQEEKNRLECEIAELKGQYEVVQAHEKQVRQQERDSEQEAAKQAQEVERLKIVEQKLAEKLERSKAAQEEMGSKRTTLEVQEKLVRETTSRLEKAERKTNRLKSEAAGLKEQVEAAQSDVELETKNAKGAVALHDSLEQKAATKEKEVEYLRLVEKELLRIEEQERVEKLERAKAAQKEEELLAAQHRQLVPWEPEVELPGPRIATEHTEPRIEVAPARLRIEEEEPKTTRIIVFNNPEDRKKHPPSLLYKENSEIQVTLSELQNWKTILTEDQQKELLGSIKHSKFTKVDVSYLLHDDAKKVVEILKRAVAGTPQKVEVEGLSKDRDDGNITEIPIYTLDGFDNTPDTTPVSSPVKDSPFQVKVPKISEGLNEPESLSYIVDNFAVIPPATPEKATGGPNESEAFTYIVDSFAVTPPATPSKGTEAPNEAEALTYIVDSFAETPTATPEKKSEVPNEAEPSPYILNSFAVIPPVTPSKGTEDPNEAVPFPYIVDSFAATPPATPEKEPEVPNEAEPSTYILDSFAVTPPATPEKEPEAPNEAEPSTYIVDSFAATPPATPEKEPEVSNEAEPSTYILDSFAVTPPVTPSKGTEDTNEAEPFTYIVDSFAETPPPSFSPQEEASESAGKGESYLYTLDDFVQTPNPTPPTSPTISYSRIGVNKPPLAKHAPPVSSAFSPKRGLDQQESSSKIDKGNVSRKFQIRKRLDYKMQKENQEPIGDSSKGEQLFNPISR
jgi:hypothetical protein